MSRGARERGPPPAPPTFRGRGTGFRVLIKGLPISASWQDLKVSIHEKTALYIISSSVALLALVPRRPRPSCLYVHCACVVLILYRKTSFFLGCCLSGTGKYSACPFVQDHFRVIVKPAYTNVYRERGGVLGVVEFDTREDLERAIRKLDDTEFKNPFDRAFIRVVDESDDRGRSRSCSPRGR